MIENYPERLRKFHERPHGRLVDAALMHALEGLPTGASVLDYGCGTGVFLDSLSHERPELRLCGFDPTWGGGFVGAGVRLHRYELPPHQVDAIVCSEVLGHVDRPDETLLGMRMLLKQHGMLLLVIPSKTYEWAMTVPNLLTGYKSDPTMLHRWFSYQLADLVREAGFVVQSVVGVSPVLGALHESILLTAWNPTPRVHT